MKGYEQYCSQGLPWCRSFPGHWSFCRAKYMYKKESRPVRESDDVITCFRDGTVTLRKNRRTTGFTEAINETGYQGIRKGDLVIHVMDAFAGSVGVSDSDGKGTPVYSVCTPLGDYNNMYYALVLREMAKRGFIQSLYKGIRERSSDFRFDVFAKQYLPVPPRDEQDQIVRFLDWKVSAINRLVVAKKKEIELLEERKMALINAALTRGIKGSRKKQSQTDGLGMIPDGWSEKALKWYATSNDESLGSTTPSDFELDYIDISAVGFGKLKTGPVHMTFENAPLRARRIAREGDTILSTVRTYLKSVCYIDSEQNGCIVSTGFSVLRPRENVYPRLLGYALCCDYFIRSVIRNSSGISYPAINDRKLMSLKLALPTAMKEQKELFDYIVESTSSTDKMIALISSEIHVLEEMKIRLISDAVTGRIDVRGVEVPEFERVEEDLAGGGEAASGTEEMEGQGA